MVSDEEHLQNLIVNAYHREMEVYGYSLNISNYAAVLASLPQGDWPANLAAWASTDVANLPANMSDEDVDLVSDYQYRDRLRTLLRTERAEKSKSERILVALKAQIGSDADAKIAAYKSSVAPS